MAAEPRTLDQIIASLGSIYDPQIQSVQRQQAALPGQQQTDEAQLDAKRQQGYDDIMNQARARGVGFGGIPLGEQAKYQANEYLPAVAKLRAAYVSQGNSLTDMINQINERRYTNANQIRSQEQDYYMKMRQLEDAEAEAAYARAHSGGGGGGDGFSPTYGGGGGGGGPQNNGGGAGQAGFTRRLSDGGFNFHDANGRSISAAQYYAIKGGASQGSWRSFLGWMANMGDPGAKQLLGFVGDDMRPDQKKVTSQGIANLYNAFMWGTPYKASYSAPSNSYKPPSGQSVMNLITKR